MNTALYILRALQAGLTLSDFEVLDYGMVIDVITEQGNDNYKYKPVATQADFDKW